MRGCGGYECGTGVILCVGCPPVAHFRCIRSTFHCTIIQVPYQYQKQRCRSGVIPGRHTCGAGTSNHTTAVLSSQAGAIYGLADLYCTCQLLQRRWSGGGCCRRMPLAAWRTPPVAAAAAVVVVLPRHTWRPLSCYRRRYRHRHRQPRQLPLGFAGPPLRLAPRPPPLQRLRMPPQPPRRRGRRHSHPPPCLPLPPAPAPAGSTQRATK